MKKWSCSFRSLFVMLLPVLMALSLQAQPVRVTVTIPPPYPIHLEDYMQFSDQTIITLTNLSNDVQQVKLLTTITGDNGISAQVRQSYLPVSPVVLNPMEVKVLTGGQLQAVNANLGENDVDVVGVPISRIIQTEVLPEGNYQVCVRAHSYQTGEPLSPPNFGCANVWITNYDPPLIILPELNAEVQELTPQFVNFVWTPSGPAAYTRYRFEIVDMDLNNLQNINDAFDNIAVQLLFRQDDILTPSFQYQVGMPPLKKGHQYAIRVTAYDPLDRVSYKNQGRSPVSAFYYTDSGLADVGGGNDPLGPGDIVSNPPDNNPNPDPEYQDPCTPLGCTPQPAVGSPVNTWKVGDEIQVGYFKLKLTATVWDGNFLSGSGEVEAPFFNTWIKVNFQNLQVNGDGKVLGAATIKADYDNGANVPPNLKNIAGGLAGISGSSIKNVADFVKAGNKFTEALGGQSVKLPIGFKTNVGGQEQIIVITGLELSGNGAMFNAFMHVDMPEANNQVLAFGAKGVCFHPTGMSEGGLQRLTLVEDFTYPFGPNIDLTLIADNGQEGGSFVNWDCEGYESLQVEGEFAFKNAMLVPEDGNGQVKARFLVNAPAWGDLIAEVDFDPFRVKGTKGLKFDFNEVVLDFSEINNIPNMTFPGNYQGNKNDTWKGFYFKTINITLPDYLRKNGQTVSVEMKDALIDKLGYTGKLTVEPVISLGDGTVGGWSFSLDVLELEFVNNSMTGSYFDGKVKLPIAETGLGYHCLLSNSNQELETEFQISNLNDLHVPMWVADFELLNGSLLTISAQGNDVTAEAKLSGGLTINGEFPDIPNLTIDLPDVAFENLKIRNKQPYLSCEYFSMASPQKTFNGFNISIDPEKEGEGIGLEIDQNGNTAAIDIGFSVALHSKGTGISGLTNFSIIGKMTEQQGKQKWVYEKAQLNKIVVDATLAALKIDGEIEFYNGDLTYGKGFRGELHAVFTPFIDVTATAQFGKVDGFRYWFVDAKAIFKPGITVGPAVAIYGFGGGAYYHMTPESMPPIADINTDQAQNVANFNLDAAGQSGSGVKYVPDSNILFGLKASVVFGVSPDPTPFNCDIEIEANFNNNGGLNYIRFSGQGYFMTDVLDRENPKVYLGLELQYWHPEKKFHGVCEFYMNFVDILEGDGQIVIHSEPGTWYFLAGTPDDRINIKIFNSLAFGTYMMMGNQIPGPADLPAEFAGKPGLEGFQLSRIIPDAAEGIAFGQEFKFDPGELRFLIFYAEMYLHLGYDVGLYKGIQCDAVDDPGLNSWYGIGQAYAGFGFACGLDIDLWFLKTKIEVFSAYLYAAVQMGLPNPTWARGWVYGEYSVLNGMLHGSFNFNFKAGTICLPPNANDPFGGLEVISDFSPDGDAEDVFVTPEVAFALPLEKEIPVKEVNEDAESKTHLFRFYLKDIVVERIGKKDGEQIIEIDPQDVEGNFAQMQDKLAQFNAESGYKPNSKYKITARVYGKRKVDGSWKIITKSKNSNETYYEVKSSTFVTGERPDKFTNNNIVVTYPRRMHRYFHKSDVQNGVINFINDVDYIFQTKPQNPQAYKYQFVVKFHKIKGGATEVAEVPMQYNKGLKRLTFDVPDNLEPEAIYMAQFVAKLIKNPQGWIVNNGPKISTVEETTDLGMGNKTTVQKTQINSTEVGGGEHELYKFFFRTSKHTRFKNKWDKYKSNVVDKYTDENPNYEHRIFVEMEGDEPLDYYDVTATPYTKGSLTLYNATQVGLFLNGYHSETASGALGKVYQHYRRHLDYWMDTNYGYHAEDVAYWRETPHPNAYGINSRRVYDEPITQMEMYAIGLKYIGNGKSGKLTMGEINADYFDGLDQGGGNNGQGMQAGNGNIAIPPNQGHPNGLGLLAGNANNGGGGIQMGILNLNNNNNGNGGGGPGPGMGGGMNIKIPDDFRATIIYDHLHVSHYDREHFYDAMMFIGGIMGGSGWLHHGAMWDKFVEESYPVKFKPSNSPNSRYYYKWFTAYPGGVQWSGGELLHGKEEMFKY